MKVICIIDKTWSSKKNPGDKSGPQFGEECTASQCPVHKDAYDIAEYPYNSKGLPQSFMKSQFVPVSEIDETEFVREYNKELV